MSDLSPATKALLQAAREGMTPDAAALARVKANVAATAAAGGAAAGAGAGVAAKLAMALAVAGVVAGGATLAVHQAREREVEVAPPAPAVASVEPVRSTPESPTLTPTPSPSPSPSLSPSLSPPPNPPTHPHAIAAAPTPPSPPPPEAPAVPPPPPAAHASLAREVSLVDSAQASLHRADLRGALTIIATYDTETAGHGQLAEDAAAIEVEALCRLHDDSAAARFTAFDARWPGSAQRTQLSGVCK